MIDMKKAAREGRMVALDPGDGSTVVVVSESIEAQDRFLAEGGRPTRPFKPNKKELKHLQELARVMDSMPSHGGVVVCVRGIGFVDKFNDEAGLFRINQDWSNNALPEGLVRHLEEQMKKLH